MARKSAALRLQQTNDLLSAYEAAGLGNDYNCRFIRDMAYRLGRKKYPTKRQRDWLDSLIEEGVPAPKGDAEYIAKIDEAIATEGIDFAQILIDFRGKLVRGYNLSEKQVAWCDNLIEQASQLRNGTFWRPDEETTARLRLAVSLKDCYDNSYWSTHGGMYKALTNVERWLSGDAIRVDEWSVNMAFKAVRGRLRDLECPRFEVGNKCFVSRPHKNEDGRTEWKPEFGIVIDGPKVQNRSIVYDVLVGSEVISTPNAKKRR